MTLHAGTDAGSVAIFDPAALPHDYESVIKSDTIQVIEHLHRTGKLFWFDTHSDGSYRLKVFEKTELPENLARFVTNKEEVQSLHIPSGRLYFAGIEYISREDFAPLLKHPHMGESIQVTPGSHAATVYTFRYPEDLEENLLKQNLSAEQLAARNRGSYLVPAGFFAFAVLILFFFLLPLTMWAMFVLPVCSAIIGTAVWLIGSRTTKAADLAAEQATDDYPDFALVTHASAANSSLS